MNAPCDYLDSSRDTQNETQIRDTIKLFCYETGGVWVCAKRLEQGTFRWPAAGTRSVQLTPTDLQLLLSGIDPARTRLRGWWQPVVAREAR